jgi:sugar fermentation stimulation protein A
MGMMPGCVVKPYFCGMDFKNQLISGRLIKRYKRFLADVQLEDGAVITAHCTNSGSMKSCIETNAPVFLSPAENPNRKTRYTWEMIFINNGWVGINTMMPNKLALEWVKSGAIDALAGYTSVVPEVKFGDSRFDLFAENDRESCFIEVKNVTMKEGDFALFPDAVTTRGKKHLTTLMGVKRQGIRAVMLYVVQRMDVSMFAPAEQIDPEYAQTLRVAMKQGVEVVVIQVKVSPERIVIARELPFEI